VDHAFGSVAVNAGVEPKPIEWQGEIVEDEPVKVEMAVRLDAFEAICRQAADAFDHGRILAARVTLASESFPGWRRTNFTSTSRTLMSQPLGHTRSSTLS
jgi:hypothetical protein